MIAFLLKRLLLALGVALVVSILGFALLEASGDAAIAIAGAGSSAEDIDAVRRNLGLDRPPIERYLEWLGHALSGDLGQSHYFNTSVAQLIAEHIKVTLLLGLIGLSLAIAIGVPLGVIAAIRANTWIDRVALAVAVLGQAMPTFWFSLMLILVFGVWLQWLPISGADTWRHFVLPSLALAYFALPAIMRLTRAGMLDVLTSDYIRTARAKGLRPGRVLLKHALRNALIPVVSLAAVQFGFMLGGSIIVETIFSLHGMGHLAWVSISRSDQPTMLGVVLVLSLLYILLTLAADLINAWLDPRIRVTS
jgi:peptide/nickel transport system permease protein